MYVYMNKNHEIKSVNSPIGDLDGYYIDDEFNPFKDWSYPKICCYKADIVDGTVMMFTPYVTSDVIESIDRLAKQNEVLSDDIVNTQLGLVDTFEAMESNTVAITLCEEALAEIYEMIIGE